MEQSDFTSLDTWYKYKFERESKNEQIELLQARAEQAEKDYYNLLVFDKIVLAIIWLEIIANLVCIFL